MKILKWHILSDKQLKEQRASAKDEQRKLDAAMLSKITHHNVVLTQAIKMLKQGK